MKTGWFGLLFFLQVYAILKYEEKKLTSPTIPLTTVILTDATFTSGRSTCNLTPYFSVRGHDRSAQHSQMPLNDTYTPVQVS